MTLTFCSIVCAILFKKTTALHCGFITLYGEKALSLSVLGSCRETWSPPMWHTVYVSVGEVVIWIIWLERESLWQKVAEQPRHCALAHPQWCERSSLMLASFRMQRNGFRSRGVIHNLSAFYVLSVLLEKNKFDLLPVWIAYKTCMCIVVDTVYCPKVTKVRMFMS